MNTQPALAQTRPLISFPDSRLTRLFRISGEECATVSDYANTAGLDVTEVLTMLEPHLDDGTVSIETLDGHLFVHTAPDGRRGPRNVEVPANLWERLRANTDARTAYAYWQVAKNLTDAGWMVTAKPADLRWVTGPDVAVFRLGVRFGGRVVGLEPFPSPGRLGGNSGLCDMWLHAGVSEVAVTADSGRLDEMTTTVRRWLHMRRWVPALRFMILEAPAYAPVLLTPADGAVEPVWVSRHPDTNHIA